MRRKWQVFLIVVFVLVVFRFAPSAQGQSTPRRVRIGVDIRFGLQACIDSWTPITEYLSKTIPDYRFVIVPLASQQDLVRVLEKGNLDFMVLDPAMELMAEDRFGVSPLATLIESAPGDATLRPADASSSGAIICRADREDIKSISDLRGKRLSAVKPWSLTGWIAQWELLKNAKIDPQQHLAQVVFEGTHNQVVKSVLAGESDVGTLDADLLVFMLKNRKIPDKSLCVINHEGDVVPLTSGENAAATEFFPGRMLAKSATTSDELAKRVVEALLSKSLATTQDQMPSLATWTVPANSSKVRRTLQSLMGQDFADSAGFPLPYQAPEWLGMALAVASVCVIAIIVVLVLQGRGRRRELLVEEQLETTRREVAEARADKQRLDTILSLAGCGIDIVDDDDQVVYADAGLEQRLGDWRGRKCYQYFSDQETPCACCQRPGPLDTPENTIVNLDAAATGPNAVFQHADHQVLQMIGIPFRDESGKWLYARIHIPVSANLQAGNLQHA